jgi:hypothetical protein
MTQQHIYCTGLGYKVLSDKLKSSTPETEYHTITGQVFMYNIEANIKYSKKNIGKYLIQIFSMGCIKLVICTEASNIYQLFCVHIVENSLCILAIMAAFHNGQQTLGSIVLKKKQHRSKYRIISSFLLNIDNANSPFRFHSLILQTLKMLFCSNSIKR